jgi:kinesin family protein 15
MNCAGETLSTLRFAQRAKCIRNRALLNQEFQGNVAQLQEEIKRLKHELLLVKSGSVSLDGVNSDDPAGAAVIAMASRLTQLVDLYDSMKQQLSAERDLVQAQAKQIQTDKMVIKFRDSAIKQLKKKELNESTEIMLLRQEIAGLRNNIEHPPELARFAAENMQLRESLKQYENCLQEIANMESLQQEHLVIESALSAQVTDLNAKIQNQTQTMPPEMLAKMHELVRKHHQLKDDKHRLVDEHRKQINMLADEKLKQEQQRQELIEELDSYKQLLSKMEETRHATEADGDLKQRLTDLKDENTRLKVAKEHMEKKNRRLSDFTSQSRVQSQQQLDEMAERLCQISAEKDASDSKLTRLTAELLARNKLIHDLQTKLDELNKELVKMKQDAKDERYEAKIRQLEEDVDNAAQQYESTRIECDDLQGELDFANEKVEQLETQIGIKSEELKYLENVLREHLSQIKIQSDEIAGLKQVLNNTTESNHELMKSTETISNLQSQLDIKESRLELITSEMEQLNAKHAQCVSECESSKAAVRELGARLMETQSSLNEAKRSVNTYETMVSDLQKENMDLRNVVTSMENRELGREQSLELMKADVMNKEMKFDQLMSEKMCLETRVVELEAELKHRSDKHSHEVAYLQSCAEDTMTDLHEWKEKFAESSHVVATMQEQLKRTQGRLVGLTETIDSLKIELKAKDEMLMGKETEQVATLTRELEKRSQRMAELEKLSVRFETLSSQFETTRQEKNAEVARVSAQLNEARSRESQLMKQIKDLQCKIDREDGPGSDKLKSELRVKDEALEMQRRELEQYSIELSRLRASLVQLASNNDRIMAQLESAQEDNESLLEKVKQLESSTSNRDLHQLQKVGFTDVTYKLMMI